MNRVRGVIVVLAAMLAVMLCFGGLVLVVAGDDVLSLGRSLLLRASLALREDDLQATVGSDATPVRFDIAPGESPLVIAQRLGREALITDTQLFYDYIRAERLDSQLEAGTYFLNQTLTIPQIAQRLTDSRFSHIPFRMLAGWRLEQVAEAVDANRQFRFSGADFMALVRAGAVVDPIFAQRVGMPPGMSLEGFLLPGDYRLPPEATPAMLRDALIDAFTQAVSGEIEQAAAAQGWSLYRVVTLASIVQREAFHADEKPLIAGVYRNRLDINMKLDADPTVQYPLANTRGGWWAAITRADYTGVISPYNTYLNTGLPPGPIASPGLDAIRAVLNPTPSDYYFFRADCRNDGYHDFARTYAEHLANGC